MRKSRKPLLIVIIILSLLLICNAALYFFYVSPKLHRMNKEITEQKKHITKMSSTLEEQTKTIAHLQKDKNGLQKDKTNLKKALKKKDTLIEDKKKTINHLQDQILYKKAQKVKAAKIALAKQSEPDKKNIQKMNYTSPTEQAAIPSNNNKTIRVKATAYTAHCSSGCTGVTATGLDLDRHPNVKVIAVDPSVIPLGSTVYVPGYGTATAADTGGAINGKHIDVYVKSHTKADHWGIKFINIQVLN